MLLNAISVSFQLRIALSDNTGGRAGAGGGEISEALQTHTLNAQCLYNNGSAAKRSRANSSADGIRRTQRGFIWLVSVLILQEHINVAT